MGFWEEKIMRREFLKRVALGCLGVDIDLHLLNGILLKRTGKMVPVFKEDAPEKLWRWSKEAYFYSRLGRSVQCNMCPNRCILSPGTEASVE